MYKQIELSAPGKLILCGEHSVVYGYKALATAINLRTRLKAVKVCNQNYFQIVLVDFNNKSIRLNEEEFNAILKSKSNLEDFQKNDNNDDKILNALKLIIIKLSEHLRWDMLIDFNIEIKSEIPIASGLGSSASFSVAISAFFLLLSNQIKFETDHHNKINSESLNEINKHAHLIERLFHGKPSGIDNSVSTYGKYVLFEKGQIIEKFESSLKLPVLIVNSQMPKQTAEQVRKVGKLYDKHMSIINYVFKSIDSIVQTFVNILKSPSTKNVNNFEDLNNLININQGLLYSLQISNSQLNSIVNIASEFNLSCKITGAGGGGCCYILLSSSSSSSNLNIENELVRKLNENNFLPIRTSLGCEGIKIENLF